MKKIFTILLAFITLASFAQRSEPISQLEIGKTEVLNISTKEIELEMINPGIWEWGVTGAAIYWWSQANGYVFGTNAFGDLGYGMRFDAGEPYYIHSVYYWIGVRNGETGNVTFAIRDWDEDNGVPGNTILAQKTFPLSEVLASLSFVPNPDHGSGPQPGAFLVEFDDPVWVNGSYFVAVDISDLGPYTVDTYRLANVSSNIASGGMPNYAFMHEDDGEGGVWVPVTSYIASSLDLAIFPMVEMDNVVIVSVTDLELEDFAKPVGTTFDELELPGSVSMKIAYSGDLTEEFDYNPAIEWTSVPEYNPDMPGVYEFTGTFLVDEAIQNPGAFELFVNVNVTLEAEIASVLPIVAINEFVGTLLADVDLPATVDVVLENDVEYTLNVTWDGGTPAYDGDVVGTYVFTGTLELVTGILNTAGHTATVDVVVFDSSKEIESVQPITNINVYYGVVPVLPTTVVAVCDDATTVVLDVTWDAGTPEFNANTVGTYVFKGTLVLIAGYANTAGVEAEVTVIVSNKEVTAVAAIAPISVAYGTALAAIGLPATVGVTLVDASTTTLAIVWDGGTPAYNANVSGSYTFVGTLTLVDGIVNTAGHTATVVVTVLPRNIVSVAAIDDIVVGLGTELADVDLPATVSVTLTDASTTDLAVVWNAGAPVYNGDLFGEYVFTGTITLIAGITNTGNLTATVEVTVEAEIVEVPTLADIKVNIGTELASIGLPATVEVVIAAPAAKDGAVTAVVAVTWDAGTPAYNATAGEFVFEGELVLVAGLLNPEDLFVTVKVIVAQFYEVTFIVDVTNAVAEGGVEFDPAEHDVYITGSFAGWAEPGSNQAYKLNPAVVLKEGDLYDFFESWENYPDWAVAGGNDAGTNTLGAWTVINNKAGILNWGSADYSFENEGTDYGFIIYNPTTSDPATDAHPAYDGTKYGAFTQANTLNDDKWLISPALEVTATSELSFWAKAITHAYGKERFRVYVSTSGPAIANFTKISAGDFLESELDWTAYTFDLSSYGGQTIHFAIQYVSYDAFFFFIDAITVTDVIAPEVILYTITLTVEEGAHEYKYFLVEDAPTWSLGETAGGPNRKIDVTEDMTIEDIWGEIENSVPSLTIEEFSLYPNPARDIINLVSGSKINTVRVFDVNGRLVFSQSYNANQVILDVNNFKNGLYIMQISTNDGVKNQKFIISK
jgi:hypothetical protein